MWSKPTDLITAWLIAAALLASIAIAPFVQINDPPATRSTAIRDVATQRFDLKAPGAVQRHGVEPPLARERSRNDDRSGGRVTGASFSH